MELIVCSRERCGSVSNLEFPKIFKFAKEFQWICKRSFSNALRN
jgi:hypothetical protein